MGNTRMRMKRKQLCACVAAVFLALIFPVLAVFPVLAEGDLPEEQMRVYVFVTDAGGETALAYQELPLSDADGDGMLTVHDALLLAHDGYFDGGAASGFASEETEEGRIASMFWGEDGGHIGIYVNHMPVADLLVPLQEGDLLDVFARVTPEDGLYCYFDVPHASVGGGEALTLTLAAADSGEAAPIAGAVICIDGKDTAFTTDAEGKVTLQFDGSGSCIVSARKDGAALLPPVCAVTVSAEEPAAGDRGALFRWILLSVGSLTGIVLALRWRVRRTDPL